MCHYLFLLVKILNIWQFFFNFYHPAAAISDCLLPQRYAPFSLTLAYLLRDLILTVISLPSTPFIIDVSILAL